MLLERIKEQPRAHQRAAEALRHAPLTNTQKSLLRIFVKLFFVRSFLTIYFCNSLLCAVFLTIYFYNGSFCAQFFDYLFRLDYIFAYLIKMTN